MKLKLGTRGSQLAVTQSTLVADSLRDMGHEVQLVTIRTQGDKERGSLLELGGLGVFAAELRRAVLDAECDFAVHSLKDLPVATVPGLVIAAVPEREDPRDALCSGGVKLRDLPSGSKIGTGSPRRVAQLRAIRPDCDFVDIRGNVGTRLARVVPGDLDAVVLAAAGLKRLGLVDQVSEYLDILPAPAQGALAIECRADDAAVLETLKELDSPLARAEVVAERALLEALGGGCAAPISARAKSKNGTIHLTAGVFALDGSQQVVDQSDGAIEAASQVGAELGQQLVNRGASTVTQLDETRDSRLNEFHEDQLWGPKDAPIAGLKILVPQKEGRLSHGLQTAGAEVWAEPLQRRVNLDVAIGHLPPADWYAITSANTVEALSELGLRIPVGAKIAAVGEATAEALRSSGYAVDLVPERRWSAKQLVDSWPEGHGTVVVPCSREARPTLVEGLIAKGWDVTNIGIYSMEPVEPSSALSAAWRAGNFDGVLITAGSIANAIEQALGPICEAGLIVVAFGEPSAEVLVRLGVSPVISKTQNVSGVVDALIEARGQASR